MLRWNLEVPPSTLDPQMEKRREQEVPTLVSSKHMILILLYPQVQHGVLFTITAYLDGSSSDKCYYDGNHING